MKGGVVNVWDTSKRYYKEIKRWGVWKSYFRLDYIKHILQHHPNSNMATHYDLIKMLMCLEIWHKIYIESDDIYKPKLVMSDFY